MTFAETKPAYQLCLRYCFLVGFVLFGCSFDIKLIFRYLFYIVLLIHLLPRVITSCFTSSYFTFSSFLSSFTSYFSAASFTSSSFHLLHLLLQLLLLLLLLLQPLKTATTPAEAAPLKQPYNTAAPQSGLLQCTDLTTIYLVTSADAFMGSDSQCILDTRH